MKYIRIETKQGEIVLPVGTFSVEARSTGMGCYLRLTSIDRVYPITRDEYTRIALILLRYSHD